MPDKKTTEGLIGAAIGGAIGWFAWAPLLGYTSTYAKFAASLPLIQVGITIGGMEGAMGNLIKPKAFFKIYGKEVAAMLATQYAANMLASNEEETIRAVMGAALAEVVAKVFFPGNYLKYEP